MPQLYSVRLRVLFSALFLGLAPWAAWAQGVGIGTTTPNASAALDVSSTNKGLLPPRLTQSQRDVINPASTAAGLVIFNTTAGVLNTWDGTKWVAVLADTSPPLVGTFAYTGAPQTYIVPSGVTALAVDMAGAAGGRSSSTNPYGYGGRVQATLAVVPGQVLTIYVGQTPGSTNGGYNGGGNGNGGGSGLSLGGGGASDIRTNGTALRDRVLVAGGGGGEGSGSGGNSSGSNGAGGGTTAGAGGTGGSSGVGGGGGTQAGGGAATAPATAGALGAGGNGNSSSPAASIYYAGGGGGGGYYGGGGGYAYSNSANGFGGGGGGGGGSSYAGAGTTAVTHTQGYRAGNGYVMLSPVFTPPTSAAPAPYLDGSNISGVIKNQTTQQDGSSFNISDNGTIGGSASVLGNVSIGTDRTSQKLEVAGGNIYISSRNQDYGLVFPDGTKQTTAATAATGDNFIQNSSSQQASSNFNISGTGTIGGSAVVNGYTRLGSNAPAIKLLVLNSTVPSAAGNQAFVAHGLSDAKILSVTALVASGTDQVPPNFTLNAGDLYGVYLYNNQVVIQTGSGTTSSRVVGQPIRILLTYQQ